MGFGMPCVVMVLVVRSAPCTLGMGVSLLTCMVFYKCVFDSLDVLNDFIKQVVVNRRDTGIRKWTWWLREDLGARPYAWLRPDFRSSLLPFLVVKAPLTEKLPGFWLSLISLMLSSAKLGCLFSVGLVTLLSLLTSSWLLWVIFCLRNLSLDLRSDYGSGFARGCSG